MTTTLLEPAPPVAEPVPPQATGPRARWERPALLALLGATALLYIWGLGASGWANSYYTAAVQAASTSWKALFFGSFDAANFITVDKTPASLWVMGLSGRIFGFHTWSMLVPQALLGVAAVALLYSTVRRWFGPAAGLLAGAVLALTPVAVLMFRFNNPDALLVLLLVAGGYAMTRAVERGSTTWIMLAGAFVGFGFLTKMLQALLVVPAFAVGYLVAAPGSIGRRIGQVLLAGLAMIVAAGWWIAVVELWPAASRPYIGGSQNNSILELTLGYNGLDRLTGEQTGSVGGGGGQAGGWGATGWTRMFGTDIGGQAGWLLPAALILLVVGLVVSARHPRTDRTRAALILWGGWLLVTGLVFSFMAGIFHQYYTVALAPAIGAVVGIGGVLLWRRRSHWAAVSVLAATVVVTAVWSYTLLARSTDWYPWLRTLVLIGGIVAAVALLATLVTPERFRRLAAGAAAALAVAVALAGPLAYSLNTAATPQTGSIVTAGPAVAGAGFGGGGGPGQGGPGLGGAGRRDGGIPGGGIPGGAIPGGGAAGGDGGTGGRGGMGGLLNASVPNSELVAALQADADSYTWIVATVGANNAAGYQIATGRPVMAIGGFNGSDASPTLAQFQAYVAAGRIHYFAGGSGFRANGGSGYGQEIAAWVAATYPGTTIGGATLYDLS